MLTPRQEPYYILDYRELDELIRKHFNKPTFNCVADYEWHNDSQHTGEALIRNITDEDSLDYDDLQEFLNHPRVPLYPVHWSTLLAELARRGEVPEGNYIIEICW